MVCLVFTHELFVDTVQGCRQDYRTTQGQGSLKGSESFLIYDTKSNIVVWKKKTFNFQKFLILCTNIDLRSSTDILISFHANNRI